MGQGNRNWRCAGEYTAEEAVQEQTGSMIRI